MKKCTKCNIEKSNDDFHKSSKSKDGLKSNCKECVLSKEKERRSTDTYKERARKYNKSISNEKKELYKERKKGYYRKNKERILSKNKKYREENEDSIKVTGKRYREENKEKMSIRRKEYRDRPDVKAKRKEWEKNNPEKIKSYRETYSKSDSIRVHRKNWYKSIRKRKPYVLAWRKLLTNTLKRINGKKESETIKLLGYSAIQLKEHIENLFLEGMSWDNYGKWHIDHIKMVSTFDIDTPIDIINSLNNLRPLWAEDNCSRKFN